MPGVWVFPGGVVEEAERSGSRRGAGESLAGDEEVERAHRACAVRELREESGIELSGDAELLPWSRWITPAAVPVRFDTRFYVALAPPHSPPRPDGRETVEARWLAPRSALELHQAGELPLVFPTIKHLESLLPYEGSKEVLAAARERRVEPALPRVVGEGDDRRIVLPGEPGYG